MGDDLVYAVRGSRGISIKRGFASSSSVLFNENRTSRDNPCSAFQFSNGGHIFAYCDSERTRAFEVAGGKELLNVDLKKTRRILFTPRDSHMITYEPYVTYGQKSASTRKPEPNVNVFSVTDGKHVAAFVAKKEETWMPQFSDDESTAVRLVGSELLVHEGCHFGKYDRKIVVQNIKNFAVSPGPAPLHVACYSPSSGSTPGRVQVRCLDPPFSAVAAKNFFKTEKAVMQWNSRGTAVLVLASTDVDSSNQSYYGEQHVYLLNVNSGDSFKVLLSKAGPVHAAKWNPNGREFCVCYGFMPAMVGIYNLRGDETFHTDEGPRNDIFYNAFGSILLTCGFGNLGKGKMEFWDVEKKKLIVAISVPNTTLFEWAPDGQHFLTATTAPRLRIDNCFRIWHYTGVLLEEELYDTPNEELWEVKFQPMHNYGEFEIKEPKRSGVSCAGLSTEQKDRDSFATKAVEAAQRVTAYVPPHLRKGDNSHAKQQSNGKQQNTVKMTEAEKKTLAIKKKLRDIELLKARLSNGEELQKTQLEKIAKEPELIAQLAAFEEVH
uniref:Eukaryotic translation initiation factor 2A n=1 Tax=Haemonchus contortus TaxID=6289 RepID=A0A7I4YXW6_HAECO